MAAWIPGAGFPLRALAAVVAYSRVHTGVHYPGDVLAGVAHRHGRRRGHGARRAAAGQEAGRALGLSLRAPPARVATDDDRAATVRWKGPSPSWTEGPLCSKP